MRVNARLDEQTAQQLDYLTLSTGHSVSHVLRDSVARYYMQLRAEQAMPTRLLALLGSADSGRSDVASNVKRVVGDAINAKHQPPPQPGPQPKRHARRR
jgi:predicted Ser/Thr protein kinase